MEEFNIIVRVDNKMQEVVYTGTFEDCLKREGELKILFPKRWYIIRDREQALKNIEKGEIL